MCGILRTRGYKIIDSDLIAHEVLESHSKEIIDIFGEAILDSSDSRAKITKIDRKKLGAIVFSDKEKLAILESILHPKIRAKIEAEARILELRKEIYFIDIPLFFELESRGKGYQIPRVLLIYAPREMQLARIQNRDNLSANRALQRIENQLDIEKKREKADFIIENTSDLASLEKCVDSFLARIKAEI